MNNSKLLKIILILIILIDSAVCLLFYFAFEDLKNKNYNISDLKNDLSLLNEKQISISSMEKMIENTNTNIARIDNSIVKNTEYVQFIEGIETMAKNNNLSVNIDSLVLEDNPSFSSFGLNILKIKVSVDGNWDSLYSFLLQMELSSFRTRLYKLSLTNNADISEDNGKPSIGKRWHGVFEMGVLKYK